MTRASAVTALIAFAACRDGSVLGPPDSYRLLGPEGEVPAGAPPMVGTLPVDDPLAAPLVQLLADGFGAEMLRTVYLAKQFVRDAEAGGRRFPAEGRAAASEATCVVVGLDRVPYGRGLRFGRWFSAEERAGVVWLGFGTDPARDRALVQAVAGRLATYALHLTITGGTFNDPASTLPAVLGEGYRMAMEVIAREWRIGRGPQGVVPSDAGTEAQRTLFAGVRENRYALDGDRV